MQLVTKPFKKALKYLITGPTFYMGGGGSSSQPPPPDPYQTADAQFQANKAQANLDAMLNRYTQNSPMGQIAWTNTGTADAPNWTQNINLSPEQQQLYNSQLATQNNLAGQAGDYATRLQGMLASNPTGGDMATRDHVEQGLMDRLNPYLQRDQESLQTRLANQGLSPGGNAYGNAMQDYSKRVNDARLAVVGAGGDEMARQQQMQFAQRNQGIGELSALMQGSGSVQMPQYGGSTAVSGGNAPNIAGMIGNNYANQVAGANANTASKNSGLSSGLGAAATIGASYLGNR